LTAAPLAVGQMPGMVRAEKRRVMSWDVGVPVKKEGGEGGE